MTIEDEELNPNVIYYWVRCHTDTCRYKELLIENVACIPNPDDQIYIYCGGCSQRIVDCGPMDSLPSE